MIILYIYYSFAIYIDHFMDVFSFAFFLILIPFSSIICIIQTYFIVLAERMAGFMHAYTLYGAVRPFGVSIIMGVWDKDGPSLWSVEPSGIYYVRTFHSFNQS